MKKDILIAEDDYDDVEIFRLALEKSNISYELRHAENGEMLFVLLKEKIPYLLFLDINMTCKDGLSCIIEIRKNREYDTLPIIVYTGNLYQKIVDDCFENGANLYVTKAITLTSIAEKIKAIFEIDWSRSLYYPTRQHFVLN